MSLRQVQEQAMRVMIRDNGSTLPLAGGDVRCHIANIEDKTIFGEGFQERARGISVTLYATDCPKHGDTFTFHGWRYVVNSVSSSPGSAIAKFTAIAQHTDND